MNFTLPFNTFGNIGSSNFVDVLFRHIMKNGFKDITLSTIISLWLYLSLCHLQESLNKCNTFIINTIKKYGALYSSKLTELFKRYYEQFSTKEADKPSSNLDEFLGDVSMCISIKNSFEQNAILKYIFETKNIKEYISNITHQDCDKKYIYNQCFLLDIPITYLDSISEKSKLDMIIRINSEIIYSLNMNTMKINFCRMNFLENRQYTYNNFVIDYKSNTINVLPLLRTLPRSSFRVNGKLMDPSNIYNGMFTSLMFYYFYQKKFEELEKFNSFLHGEAEFMFNGKTYKNQNNIIFCSLIETSDINKMRSELEQKSNEYVIPAVNKAFTMVEIKGFMSYMNRLLITDKKSDDFVIEYVTKNDASADLLFNDFIKHVISLSGKTESSSQDEIDNNTVTLYNVDIKYETSKSSIIHHNVWGSNTKTNSDITSDSEASPNPPQNILETTTIEKKLKYTIQKINTVFKPFKYLYLESNTKELLYNYINNFKNNKDKYEKFGIPYKGGILLSGTPGCGHTSCIYAIGSFIDKSIYYLDLKKIKTNTDLMDIISNIYTHSVKGAIIVFEDIDCMTDIVYSRDLPKIVSAQLKQSSRSELEIKDDSPETDTISLSCLLNILDGILSPKETMFIITTNHKSKLDSALIRPGRMDLNIELKKCNREQLQQIFRDIISVEIQEDLLALFPEYEFTISEIILHLFHHSFNTNLTQRELLSNWLI